MPSAGIYKAGSTLQFSVQYDEPVVVGGTPSLSLLVGANARTATYVGGSGSETLRFQYTVAAGESDPRGVIVTGGLSLPANAWLRDQAGNAVSRTVPAVNLSAVRVDAVAPVIVGVAIPRAATYGVGATLTFTVSFSKATTVRGTPTIPIRLGAITRQAAYVSGSGTNALIFRYTILRGDTALTGIEVGNTILLAIGASIEDSVGNAARLSFTPPSARTVRVFTARA